MPLARRSSYPSRLEYFTGLESVISPSVRMRTRTPRRFVENKVRRLDIDLPSRARDRQQVQQLDVADAGSGIAPDHHTARSGILDGPLRIERGHNLSAGLEPVLVEGRLERANRWSD